MSNGISLTFSQFAALQASLNTDECADAYQNLRDVIEQTLGGDLTLDAGKLEPLETFLGTRFQNTFTGSTPNFAEASILPNSWTEASILRLHRSIEVRNETLC